MLKVGQIVLSKKHNKLMKVNSIGLLDRFNVVILSDYDKNYTHTINDIEREFIRI